MTQRVNIEIKHSQIQRLCACACAYATSMHVLVWHPQAEVRSRIMRGMFR